MISQSFTHHFIQPVRKHVTYRFLLEKCILYSIKIQTRSGVYTPSTALYVIYGVNIIPKMPLFTGDLLQLFSVTSINVSEQHESVTVPEWWNVTKRSWIPSSTWQSGIPVQLVHKTHSTRQLLLRTDVFKANLNVNSVPNCAVLPCRKAGKFSRRWSLWKAPIPPLTGARQAPSTPPENPRRWTAEPCFQTANTSGTHAKHLARRHYVIT